MRPKTDGAQQKRSTAKRSTVYGAVNIHGKLPDKVYEKSDNVNVSSKAFKSKF